MQNIVYSTQLSGEDYHGGYRGSRVTTLDIKSLLIGLTKYFSERT